MTVKELIEELQKYPENLEVKVWNIGWEDGFYDPPWLVKEKEFGKEFLLLNSQG